nr:actin-related protein 2/3 complex subunit 1A-A-like [Lytechinus pictus]
MRFRVDDKNKITFEGKVGIVKKKAAGAVSAMAKFKNMDKKATTEDDSKKASVHQNSINQLNIHTGAKEAVTKLSSVGMDGQMVIWDQSSLEASVGGMKI